MRSEAEVRRYRDALRISRGIPCDCDQTGHAEECRVGGMVASGIEHILGWVLGDDEHSTRLVELTIRRAAHWARKSSRP
jgi:hypothetical protein